jgi:hypothetical protein
MSPQNGWFLRPMATLLMVALSSFALASHASAEWKEKDLYSFQGGTADGSVPAGGVVFDKEGNLYGATTGGGSVSCAPIGYECGTVFELTPPTQKGGSWTETLIYQFQGEASKDGSVPTGGVIFDTTGKLYGVTAYGGTGDCVLLGIKGGCGTVYELSPPTQRGGAWTKTILYSFQGGNDGYFPSGNLVFDKLGNLYGATQFGGGKGNTCNQYYGGNCGTVFKLRPPKQKGDAWTEKILHSFAGVAKGQRFGDGANPNGGLVLDSTGAVYGTVTFGGYQEGICDPGGCGATFELGPPAKKGEAWKEKVLYRFHGRDGATPTAGVIFGGNGNLYGTASAGASNANGAVYRLAAPMEGDGPWKDTVLYRFKGKDDGEGPEGALVFDSVGNLCGTTIGGEDGGTVFQLDSPKNKGTWTLRVLHTFAGVPDGIAPDAPLIFDKLGNLYSTTQRGGTGPCYPAGCGTVFEITP